MYPRWPTTPKRLITGGSGVPGQPAPQYTVAQTNAMMTAYNPAGVYNYCLDMFGAVIPNGKFCPSFYNLAGNASTNYPGFNSTTIAQAVTNAGPGGYIIWIVEQDNKGVTAATSAAAWNTLAADSGVISNGIHLIAGGTVASPGAGSFYNNFQALITRQPDGIALTAYGGNLTDGHASATQIFNKIVLWKNAWPTVPLWIVEFGIASATVVADSVMINCMNDCVNSFERDRDILRYGWFGNFPPSSPPGIAFPSCPTNFDDASERVIGATYEQAGAIYL